MLKSRLVRGARRREVPAWRKVLQVADRHARRMRRVVHDVLDAGRDEVDIEMLTKAFERGDRMQAERLALAAFEPDALATLATTPMPLQERMLDIMEDSANATRCSTRPTVGIEIGDISGVSRPDVAVIQADVEAVAADFGFAPSRITLQSYERTFEVGGQAFAEAGNYVASTGRITLNANSLNGMLAAERQALVAHEITHDAFNKVVRPALRAPASSPQIEEFMKRLAGAQPRLQRLDGVTDYSKAYWQGWETGSVSSELAINETFAELSALRYRNPAVYRRVSKAWRDLHAELMRLYQEIP